MATTRRIFDLKSIFKTKSKGSGFAFALHARECNVNGTAFALPCCITSLLQKQIGGGWDIVDYQLLDINHTWQLQLTDCPKPVYLAIEQ